MDSLGWPIVFGIVLLAPAVLILNGLIQHARRKEAAPGWLSGILALLMVLSAGTLVVAVTFGPLPTTVLATLLVLGVAELIIGLAIWVLIERRAELPQASRSFGILAAALGGLTAVMVLFIPILPGQLTLTISTPTLPPTHVAAASATPTSVHTTTPVLSPTVTLTVTSTPEPSSTPLPTATPTRIRYATPTSTVTPTLYPVCGAVAEYNVNLRAEPTLGALVLNVIPYQSVIEIAGRNSAGDWWFARYEGDWGWLDGQYLTLDTDCVQAPVLAD